MSRRVTPPVYRLRGRVAISSPFRLRVWWPVTLGPDRKLDRSRVRVTRQSEGGTRMPTHDSGQSRPQRTHEDEVAHSAESSSDVAERHEKLTEDCLLYTSPSPRDGL